MTSRKPDAYIGEHPVFKIGEHRCPWCGLVHNATTGLKDPAAPEAGDVTICFKCGGLGIFTTAMTVRRPSIEETVLLLSDPLVKQARRKVLDRIGRTL